ncbi:hypothetical protein [Saccharomonospora iraqiensis]|uniref:hypothetical protein n=1 Tax=Saccharomonospora iraqiensis TaxID=52698 RepID=UPI00022E0719|nr:hypothetical protein [Saccharomonospora iraqiensis]
MSRSPDFRTRPHAGDQHYVDAVRTLEREVQALRDGAGGRDVASVRADLTALIQEMETRSRPREGRHELLARARGLRKHLPAHARGTDDRTGIPEPTRQELHVVAVRRECRALAAEISGLATEIESGSGRAGARGTAAERDDIAARRRNLEARLRTVEAEVRHHLAGTDESGPALRRIRELRSRLRNAGETRRHRPGVTHGIDDAAERSNSVADICIGLPGQGRQGRRPYWG